MSLTALWITWMFTSLENTASPSMLMDIVLIKTYADLVRLDARDILRAFVRARPEAYLPSIRASVMSPTFLTTKTSSTPSSGGRSARVEASAVVAPVADADERKLLIDIEVLIRTRICRLMPLKTFTIRETT